MAKMRPKTINDRLRAKRDVLDVIKHTNDKLSRKDIVLVLCVRNGKGLGFPYSALVHALRELEKEGKIKRQWAWGVAGNWEYRYTFEKD